MLPRGEYIGLLWRMDLHPYNLHSGSEQQQVVAYILSPPYLALTIPLRQRIGSYRLFDGMRIRRRSLRLGSRPLGDHLPADSL